MVAVENGDDGGWGWGWGWGCSTGCMNPSGESVTAGAGGVTGGVAGVAGDTGGAPHGLIRVTGSGVGVGEVGSLMVPSLHLARAVADFRKLASARRPLV